MTVSTWVTNSISGTAFVGSALPVMTLDIPANKRLVKVVITGQAGGVTTTQVNYDKIGGAYLQMTMKLGFPTTGLKEIWHAHRAVPFSAVAIDDHNLLTANRVYTMYHGAGDRELGDVLTMSWGGNPSPAMRITTQGGFYPQNTAASGWALPYALIFRALYQA